MLTSSRAPASSVTAESFCSDCHAHREELKPSDKYKEYVTRDLPHRGDYLTQHQIDGRINPAVVLQMPRPSEQREVQNMSSRSKDSCGSARLLIAFALMVSACGDPDATATFDPETSVHPPGLAACRAHGSQPGRTSIPAGSVMATIWSAAEYPGYPAIPAIWAGPLQVHPEPAMGCPGAEGGHGQLCGAERHATRAEIRLVPRG